MSLGVLSDVHIALLELQKFGALKVEDTRWIDDQYLNEITNPNFKYLNKAFKTWKYRWNEDLKGLIDGLDQIDKDWDSVGKIAIHSPLKKQLSITEDGIKYIKEDILKRKQRFHIKSIYYEDAFYNVLVDNKKYYTDFEKEIAITHNAIYVDGSLTKQGENYLTNNLYKRLNEYLTVCSWTELTGPNMKIHTGETNDYTNWKETIKLDYKLVNKVEGLGAILLPNIHAKHHEYLSLLLMCNSPEEVCDKIKEKQKEDMDVYPFCYE